VQGGSRIVVGQHLVVGGCYAGGDGVVHRPQRADDVREAGHVQCRPDVHRLVGQDGPTERGIARGQVDEKTVLGEGRYEFTHADPPAGDRETAGTRILLIRDGVASSPSASNRAVTVRPRTDIRTGRLG
jgi:hypothetical protein